MGSIARHAEFFATESDCMKFAIVPTIDKFMNDKFIGTKNTDGSIAFRDHFAEEFYHGFADRGDEIHTIDMYDDYEKIDLILFDWPRWDWIQKLVNAGQAHKMVYYNAEPATVLKENTEEGFKRTETIFPYIMTFVNSKIDNVTYFRKNIPYYFDIDFGNVPYEEKKLLTSISGNKRPKGVNPETELYSERERVYSFFEKHYPKDFDLYGTGWNKENHPCYKGRVDSKIKTYHNYRFAICLENTKGDADYVSEKIYDCLCSGVVPVYGGAPNVDKYIPKECYIDYFSFGSIEELAERLSGMSKDEHQGYTDAAKAFITKLDKHEFTGGRFAEYIYEMAGHKKDFAITPEAVRYVNRMGNKEKLRKMISRIKKGLSGTK